MKLMSMAYHQGPMAIHGKSAIGSTITHEEMRVRMHLPPLEDVIMRRRMGLLHRVAITQSPWLLGLMAATASVPGSWAAQALRGLKQIADYTPGPPSPFEQLLAQLCTTTKKSTVES